MRLSLCLIVIILFAGCRRNTDVAARLDRAESIVMDDAAGALECLDSIAPESLTKKDDRARFTLLTSMARYRLSDYEPTDSAITLAAERFASTGDRRRQMQALFLRANLRLEAGQFSTAMTDALTAHDLALKGNSEDWKARTAEQVADLFVQTQNFAEALPYNAQAIAHYRAAGKERNALFSLCDKAVMLHATERLDESFALLDSVINIARFQLNDSDLLATALHDLYPLYDTTKQWQKEKETLLELQSLGDHADFGAAEYASLATQMMYDAEAKEALEMLAQGKHLIKNSYDREVYYRAVYKICRKTRDYDGTVNAVDSFWNNAANDLINFFRQSTVISQSRFYENKALNERKIRKRNQFISCITIIIALIIIGIVYVIYNRRVQQKNNAIEMKIAEIASLSNRLGEVQSSREQLTLQLQETKSQTKNFSNQLQEDIKNLYRKQWDTLNTICNSYFDAPNDVVTKSIVLNEFEKHIKSLTTHKNLTLLENSVNKYMDNIMTLLREECPMFKDADFVFMLLIFAGFSPRTICVFTDINIKNFYTKRRRFIERIKASNPPHMDIFINHLS